MKGAPGAVKGFFSEVATRLVADSVTDSMKFAAYVGSEFTKRVHYSGDPYAYFAEHGLDKVAPSTTEELSWQYSRSGAALGAIYPQIVRSMFLQTYAPVPNDEWQKWHASGLNIPAKQDVMSYEETEEGENEAFMLYCQECRPDLYAALSK